MVLNAATLLDIEGELSPSAGKPREVDSTLPEIRVKIIDEKGEADDVLETEDEPPISTTTFQVDKTLQVLK